MEVSEGSGLSLVPKLVSSHSNVDAVCLTQFLPKHYRAGHNIFFNLFVIVVTRIIHSCKDIIVINFKSVKFKPFQRMNTKLCKVSKYKYIDLKCNKKINFQVRVTNFIFLKCILKLNNFFREPDDDRFPSCKSRWLYKHYILQLATSS